MIGRRIIVRGRVQGVFFRNWTVGAARALGVAGWVRNRRSGDVEILAMGEADAIDALIERCRSGPPAASVDGLAVTDAEPESLEGFEKRPTL